MSRPPRADSLPATLADHLQASNANIPVLLFIRSLLDVAFFLFFGLRPFFRLARHAHLMPDMLFELHRVAFQLPDHPIVTSDSELARLVTFLQAANYSLGLLGGVLRLVRLNLGRAAGLLAVLRCGRKRCQKRETYAS